MKRFIIATTLTISLLGLSGCTFVTTNGVERVAYDSGYSNDYVYSVGYYNNRPYWGNNYYYYNTDYNWGTHGYWAEGYYNGF